MRREKIGDCELHLGDCRDILPTLGKADAAITDPPYGIKWKGCAYRDGVDWDGAMPSKEVFDLLFKKSKEQIIFGMNYFMPHLKNTRCVIAYKKKIGRIPSFSHFELAWTSLNRPAVLFECEPPGPRGWWKNPADPVRCHPAQKPIRLMRECIELFPDAKTILDPFMGSGTTGVACAEAGRKFVGIEIHEKYFDIACKRIEAAIKQRGKECAKKR